MPAIILIFNARLEEGEIKVKCAKQSILLSAKCTKDGIINRVRVFLMQDAKDEEAVKKKFYWVTHHQYFDFDGRYCSSFEYEKRTFFVFEKIVE